ncbi:MAG TPA: tetratricopeptide repeat protein [Reyranella sp.]|nr:tetratricopeptide repeat protein [Reyranella sp.]
MSLRLSFAAIVLTVALPAAAQVLTPEHHACANARGDVEPAEQERACTAVIRRGGDKENLAVAYANRGNSFLNRDLFDKAIQDYGQAIALDPRFANAWRNRGAAWFNTGAYDKALADYDAAIRLEPNEAGGYADRCSVRAVTGKPREAKVDCDKALDLDPAHVEAQGWRTLVNLQLGRIDDAERDITGIVGDYPNDPALRYLWAMVLEAKGHKSEAEGQFQVARELDADEFTKLDKLYGRFRKR